MRLSDAYDHVDADDIALELKVEIVNINYGKNASLMERCPTLAQYAIFVDTVRKYEKDHERAEAIELAIDECIREGILEDFLRKNRAEVLMLCLFEYDEEKHIRMEREDAYQDGIEDGEKRGIEIGEARVKQMKQLTQQLIADNRMDDLKKCMEDEEYYEKLLKEYDLA